MACVPHGRPGPQPPADPTCALCGAGGGAAGGPGNGKRAKDTEPGPAGLWPPTRDSREGGLAPPAGRPVGPALGEAAAFLSAVAPRPPRAPERAARLAVAAVTTGGPAAAPQAHTAASSRASRTLTPGSVTVPPPPSGGPTAAAARASTAGKFPDFSLWSFSKKRNRCLCASSYRLHQSEVFLTKRRNQKRALPSLRYTLLAWTGA